jgi:hypothetical protein
MQIMYPPHVIAAAAFYFARKFTKTEVTRGMDGKEWWEIYGVKIENLRGMVLCNGFDIDAIMLMVDTYNTLPQLKYQGKYPPSMVSPQEAAQHSAEENRGSPMQVVSTEEIRAAFTTENGNAIGNEDPEASKPPIPKASSPERAPPSSSPVRVDRGRSPRPRNRGMDSYRPRSPDQYRSQSRGSRSNSHSKRGSHARSRVDRYVSPERRFSGRERDVYIPPRKRSYDDNSPRGRDKRRRSIPEGDMSEGEVR